MPRIASLLVWVSFGLARLAAQQPPSRASDSEQLRQHLEGTNAVAVAWAAHDVRAGRCRNLIASLQRALGTWRRRSDVEAPVVCMHLLDALIALEAKVPAGEVTDLLDDDLCGTAAFVLLVREHRTNQAELLTLFLRDLEHFEADVVLGLDRQARQRQGRTQVLGDVLARSAPPGFVASIAPRCDWRLQVAVCDPGQAPPPRAIPIVPGSVRPERPAAGWPPRPAIWFEPDRLQVQRIRILPGFEHDVLREVQSEDEDPPGTWAYSIAKAVERRVQPEVRWLVAAGEGRLPRLHVAIPCDSDAAYVTAATTAREHVQQCVDALRTRFVARGDLTDAQAAKWLPARIELAVQDLRTRGAALPALPEPK